MYWPGQIQHIDVFFSSHTSSFQLLDKPWSQVSTLLPPGSCLHFLSRIGFNNPTARRFSSSVANSRSRAFRKSICAQNKNSPRMYTSMHRGGFELTKLTYTRLEDNLIRHRGDRTSTDCRVRYSLLLLLCCCCTMLMPPRLLFFPSFFPLKLPAPPHSDISFPFRQTPDFSDILTFFKLNGGNARGTVTIRCRPFFFLFFFLFAPLFPSPPALCRYLFLLSSCFCP